MAAFGGRPCLMKKAITLLAAFALGSAAFAQEADAPPPPSPKEVLDAAPADDADLDVTDRTSVMDHALEVMRTRFDHRSR